MDPDTFNYLTQENGATVLSFSSAARNCAASNVLSTSDRKLWLSSEGLPQELVLDISNLRNRPESFNCFGWHCWHTYNSNPSQVQLFVSTDNENWVKWGSFQCPYKRGPQLFPIDPLLPDCNYLKILVKATFGAAKTYLNQVFLYDYMPRLPNDSYYEEVSVISALNNSYEYPHTSVDYAPTYEEEEIDHEHLKSRLKSQLEDLQVGLKGFPHEVSAKKTPKTELPKSIPLTPKTGRVESLKTEVKQWSKCIEKMQENINLLTSKVSSLERTIAETSLEHQLKTFKEELLEEVKLLELPSARSSSEGFSHAFHQHMNDWEKRVLSPQLDAFCNNIEQRVSELQNQKETAHLMMRLQEKLHERELKLQQLKSKNNDK